jgi:hypothetical protein
MTSPYEVFYGRKPNLNALHPFLSLCFVRQSERNRNKLRGGDPALYLATRRNGVLVEYLDSSGRRTGRRALRRDVTFTNKIISRSIFSHAPIANSPSLVEPRSVEADSNIDQKHVDETDNDYVYGQSISPNHNAPVLQPLPDIDFNPHNQVQADQPQECVTCSTACCNECTGTCSASCSCC